MSVSCCGFAFESPVQNYNSVLALARLQSLCDGVVLFNNDQIVDNATRGVTQNEASKSVGSQHSSSIRDVNDDICLSLHGALLPAASLNSTSDRLGSGASLSFNLEPLELIRTLAPMPSLNVLQLDSVTQSRDKTPLNHVQSLVRAVKRPWKVGEFEADKVFVGFEELLPSDGMTRDMRGE